MVNEARAHTLPFTCLTVLHYHSNTALQGPSGPPSSHMSHIVIEEPNQECAKLCRPVRFPSRQQHCFASPASLLPPSCVVLVLQSLIKNALRASSPALAASLRRVLDGLHSQRLTPGTDAMLLRLYHPLLFRDLAAANAAVRNSAMHLLVDVFPLQDSSASSEVSA